MTIAAKVKDYLTAQGVDYALVPHPRTGSTRESALEAHVPEDHLAKAVVARDADGFCMAVIPGNSWLRLEALGDALGRTLELAPEASVEGRFPDCLPGAIPPFGWLYDMETSLDSALTSLANVYFESGDHESLVHLSGEAFNTLFRGVRLGHFSRA